MTWITSTAASYRILAGAIRDAATANGWTAVRDVATYAWNSLTDELEIVLRGAAGTVTLPHIGMRTYTQAGPKPGILLAGFSGHPSTGTAFGSLPNASPTTAPSNTAGTYIPVPAGGVTYWLSVTPRRIVGVVRTGSIYLSFYAGLLNPYETELESAFPFFLGSSCAIANQTPDTSINTTGIVEAASPSGVSGPCFWFRSSDATWREAKNSEAGAESSVDVLYPLGRPSLLFGDAKLIVAESAISFWNGIGNNTRASATRKLLPSPDSGGNISLPVPVTLISTPTGLGGADDKIIGELDGVYWISGSKADGSSVVAEETFTIDGQQYRIFPNGGQTAEYLFFALAER